MSQRQRDGGGLACTAMPLQRRTVLIGAEPQGLIGSPSPRTPPKPTVNRDQPRPALSAHLRGGRANVSFLSDKAATPSFGALVADAGGNVIVERKTTRPRQSDATRRGPRTAAHGTCWVHGMNQATLYTSAEPCVMYGCCVLDRHRPNRLRPLGASTARTNQRQSREPDVLPS